MKTNKSFTKRIKATRTGKLVVRSKGQNHYNAFDDRKTRTNKRRTTTFPMTPRARRRFLPGV